MAFLARHQLSATTTTPPGTPLAMKRTGPAPSTTKAFFTPGILRTSSNLTDFTLPPTTGHWAMVA